MGQHPLDEGENNKRSTIIAANGDFAMNR